jgi:glycosyltransferase involved in cell wall biosynthesis
VVPRPGSANTHRNTTLFPASELMEKTTFHARSCCRLRFFNSLLVVKPRFNVPRLTIIYRFLPQYRVEFFDRLRESLAHDGIELELIYGKGVRESPKQDERDLPWATAVPNWEIRFFGQEFYWQSLPSSISRSGLIVLMQETKILSNFAVLAKCRVRKQKVAFWGHGLNFQDDPRSFRNLLKRFYSHRVDWWFAYTRRVAELVKSTGFPLEQITVVQNAINTSALADEYHRISEAADAQLREQLGVGPGPVGLFCGSMYKEKRLDFLLQSCLQLRARTPDFQVLFIGAGPDSPLIEHFATSHAWAHYIGPKYELERVPYFRLADVLLMPGLVGLAILDSFALETPLVTTQWPYHSPEIDYLVNGINGIICPNSLDDFVAAVQGVLISPMLRQQLRNGCRAAVKNYTIERMVANFSEGVHRALALTEPAGPQLSPPTGVDSASTCVGTPLS